jgi:Uma2 family endonuclease
MREPFISAMDVKLSDEDVVQPDLLVVCDPQQIKAHAHRRRACVVVGIVSASSVAHDLIRKLDLYARFGVKEVWIITPHPPALEIFVLDGKSCRLHAGYEKDDELLGATFPDLRIPLALPPSSISRPNQRRQTDGRRRPRAVSEGEPIPCSQRPAG